MTAFTGVDSQNLPDVMVSVQFILAIGEKENRKSFIFFASRNRDNPNYRFFKK
ncbi:hypothetical protein LOC08_09880 [Lactobacillus delbrueckii subsp. lactis]|uniref:hypothetical protein n=1 Tax=Lactobacillus delbrueckii TaxID=1584 RepID=UPI001E2AE05C|nr:hypothetical protein [Lactobacillus delbrueckii]MCD5507463.1 hypothetical protein [Lactobacillus delbrueckii subsp. lactis]MCD5520718.1 hypothetical protein [Lactobacillus delbrueckii subsp. lactis]MCD5524555.1 hypothetical protein [Lactobacillus delbrueckii subsp. lactis]MCD5526444.1 hypothetical protein [Lactobacillus delbrueckii subsp. lactis]